MISTDGSVPFPFGKDGSGVLANCSFYGIEATLFFSAGPVCSSISAEACAILDVFDCLGSTNRSAIFLLFFSCLTLALSSPPCSLLHLSFYLNLCQKLFSLFSSAIGLQWAPDTRFFRTTTRLMSWPDGERYLFPQQCLVVTLLLSLISTLLFSRTGGILSRPNSSTHRFPRFPPSNLCSLSPSLQRTQPSVKLLSL